MSWHLLNGRRPNLYTKIVPQAKVRQLVYHTVLVLGYHGGCHDGVGAAFQFREALGFVVEAFLGIPLEKMPKFYSEPIDHAATKFTPVLTTVAQNHPGEKTTVVAADILPTFEDVPAMERAKMQALIMLDHHNDPKVRAGVQNIRGTEWSILSCH